MTGVLQRTLPNRWNACLQSSSFSISALPAVVPIQEFIFYTGSCCPNCLTMTPFTSDSIALQKDTKPVIGREGLAPLHSFIPSSPKLYVYYVPDSRIHSVSWPLCYLWIVRLCLSFSILAEFKSEKFDSRTNVEGAVEIRNSIDIESCERHFAFVSIRNVFVLF